jgi:hypothetical protein
MLFKLAYITLMVFFSTFVIQHIKFRTVVTVAAFHSEGPFVFAQKHGRQQANI